MSRLNLAPKNATGYLGVTGYFFEKCHGLLENCHGEKKKNNACELITHMIRAWLAFEPF